MRPRFHSLLRRSRTKFLRLLIFALCWVVVSGAGNAAERQQLHGHVPKVLSHLAPLQRMNATERMTLAFALPLRNQQALTDLLRQLYDPAGPNYRHFLTPAQFTAQFGPTEQDYEAAAAFATAHGLTVTYRHPNRLVLDVAGPVSNIEKALNVTMRVYRHPTERRNFYAPDTEPSLDLAVPISHISGLDNYAPPQPRYKPMPGAPPAAAATKPNSGTAPNGSSYMGNDFRAAYVPGVSLTGSGQTVGLLQYDGYSASDITYYENLAGLPNVTLTNVLLDGFNGQPTNSNGPVEVSLDIEMVISMAPGVSKVIVYEAGPNGLWHDILNRMASDNLAKQISCSWYSPGEAADPVADGIFQEMAAQGQSFFSASGDSDAFTGLIPFPGDTPYITEVGGTTLTDSGNGGPWASETVWNWNNGTGSGGGISTQYAIPSWQQGVTMTSNGGSTTMRNVPDVALTADNIYVRQGGTNQYVGGTSCAAPLWAGFTALVNQQAIANGTSPVGFINPAVYAIGASSGYASTFHDITTGNNASSSSPNEFYAAPGYDLCTGLGTPNGAALINALAPLDNLHVSPTPSFSASGAVGGPFTSATDVYTLTNIGTAPLTWTASATQSWLSLSATSGTLTASGSATVTASINANANTLTSGTYSDNITFVDTTSGFIQTRPVSLSVIGLPVITSALTATATNGVSFSYQIAATNSPATYSANGLPSGFSVNTSTGLITGTATTTGTSNVTLSVTNLAGSANATLVLMVVPAPPAITSQLTATAVNGGAFTYQITATNIPTSFAATGLPSGLSVNTSTGLISGTTTATGLASVTIAATNAGGTGSATLALTVSPPPPVIISALSATGTNGSSFTYHISATNSPTSYGATGLPSGLSVSTSSGRISGTPSAAGTSNVTISARNTAGTGSATLVLTILPRPPVINSTLAATAVNGAAFTYQITATNNPTGYNATGLPSGLGVNTATGAISGATAATGTSSVTISASNAGGTGTAHLVLTVLPSPPIITSALTATAANGASFTYQITATNNPASYGATGLPAGLSVDPTSGIISGTVTTPGKNDATITATNPGGTGSADLRITFSPPAPVITSTLSATGTTGSLFSYQIIAINYPSTYGATNLPAGLIVDPSSGIISGTLAATGTSAVTISAANTTGTGAATLTLVVLSPYAAWRNQQFLASSLADPNVSGDTADPAGDGIPNLMKYALNLNPYTNGIGGLPVAAIATTGSGNYLTLTYTQLLSATDITYKVQVSPDLQTWNSGPAYTAPVGAVADPDGLTQSVTVQDLAPVSAGAPTQFIRLEVTKP